MVRLGIEIHYQCDPSVKDQIDLKYQLFSHILHHCTEKELRPFKVLSLSKVKVRRKPLKLLRLCIPQIRIDPQSFPELQSNEKVGRAYLPKGFILTWPQQDTFHTHQTASQAQQTSDKKLLTAGDVCSKMVIITDESKIGPTNEPTTFTLGKFSARPLLSF